MNWCFLLFLFLVVIPELEKFEARHPQAFAAFRATVDGWWQRVMTWQNLRLALILGSFFLVLVMAGQFVEERWGVEARRRRRAASRERS